LLDARPPRAARSDEVAIIWLEEFFTGDLVSLLGSGARATHAGDCVAHDIVMMEPDPGAAAGVAFESVDTGMIFGDGFGGPNHGDALFFWELKGETVKVEAIDMGAEIGGTEDGFGIGGEELIDLAHD
jgi:hypothetical protein